MTHAAATHQSPEMRACIDRGEACHDVCQEVMIVASESADPAQTAIITTLLDCAEMCQTAKNLMLRASALHLTACRACGEAAERCAEACETLASQDYAACARECRRCAQACAEMA